MSSQTPANLPVFYKNLQPLSSTIHGDYRSRGSDVAPYLANTHAVPVTIDEFIHTQRHYPIVFSTGDSPVPLALMGLNEGVNTFVDEEGRPLNPVYIPAYVRRYPYLLARADANAQELSLCFDPTSDLIGDFPDGTPLFENGNPTENLNAILKFCEDFEIAAQRTGAFVKELQELDLLIDGEVAIQPADSDKPFVYRGFQMVAEEKLRELDGEKLARIHANGVLPLVIAHLFSLSLVREIFGRQMLQGKVPEPAAEPVAGNA